MTQFHMFDTVTSLRWETVFDRVRQEERRCLFLTVTGASGCETELAFMDVDSFRFQGNGQIAGFYIKDMSARGYENSVRYEVGDYEEHAIEFYCSEIRIENCRKRGA